MPGRGALRARNLNLPQLSEGGDSPGARTPKKVVMNGSPKGGPLSPVPSALPSGGSATTEELRAADKALREMEVQQKEQKVEFKQQADDSDSDDEEDEEDEEEEEDAKNALPKGKRWSVSMGRRSSVSRSSSRRESLQHLTPGQRNAMRRLSDILRDHGASRRAEERRASTSRIKDDELAERERRRLSAKKRRLLSIAGMVDLSLVWRWLEHVDLDDANGKDVLAHTPDLEASDIRAARIVNGLVSSGGPLERAVTDELEITDEQPPTPYAIKKKQQQQQQNKPAVIDLKAQLSAEVAGYDLDRGLYELRVRLADGRQVKVERTWADFRRLQRLVRKASGSTRLLPTLPRPRAISVARKFIRNVRAPKKGDRLWQKSKTKALEKWLALVGAAVSEARPSILFDNANQRPYRADEILKDFLLKFGVVVRNK